MTPIVIEDPEDEPISIEQAMLRLRVDPSAGSDEQDDILDMIRAAREWCEEYLGLSLAAKTVEVSLDAFPGGAIGLPMPPVQSITSVKYVDEDGELQTLDQSLYVLDKSRPDAAWLSPAEGSPWPSTQATVDAVVIRYVAGPTQIRYQHKQAIFLLLGHFYENRQEVESGKVSSQVAFGVQQLLNLGRIRMSMA